MSDSKQDTIVEQSFLVGSGISTATESLTCTRYIELALMLCGKLWHSNLFGRNSGQHFLECSEDNSCASMMTTESGTLCMHKMCVHASHFEGLQS